jgi:hypothetical protein
MGKAGGVMAVSSAEPTLSRESAVLLFYTLASEISERCWCSSWVEAINVRLPDVCRSAMRTGECGEWGQGRVELAEAVALRELADMLGGWQPAFAACLEVDR